MNLEAISQILDIVSFVMITPEFMGEEMQKSFQILSKKFLSIMQRFMGFMILIGIAIIMGVSSAIIEDTYKLQHNTVMDKVGIAWICIATPIGWIILASSMHSVRTTFFAFGSVIFFGTRVALIWRSL